VYDKFVGKFDFSLFLPYYLDVYLTSR